MANQTPRARARESQAAGTPKRGSGESPVPNPEALAPREDEALALLRELAQAFKRRVRKPPVRPRSGNRYI